MTPKPGVFPDNRIDYMQVGTIIARWKEVVTEFTEPYPYQPNGPVTEVPLKAKRQRWGWEVLFAHTAAYTGKILYRKADGEYKGVVQFHRWKDETSYLFSGTCRMRWDAGDGTITEAVVTGPADVAHHIPRGARHSIIALTDCVFIEASTAHFEDRVNVDEEYR
jgi:hypothetical protein